MSTTPTDPQEQLTLLAGPSAPDPASTRRHDGPVAVVRPLLAVPHLDRDFEYSIPTSMREQVTVGVAVKVRFGGQDVSGYVVDLRDVPEHTGELRPLRRVVSPEPALDPAVLRVARRIAAHDAGTVSDVLRLAVPPRHAAAEKALDERLAARTETGSGPCDLTELTLDPGVWSAYAGGPALLQHVAAGEAPGAAWCAAPGASGADAWPAAIAELVVAARRSGRGSLLVVPDARDVDRLVEACTVRLGPGHERCHQIVRLTADQGPQARYTAFLKARRGVADVVIGTRAAMFAPVQQLGLALWWDDTDALHTEPRAPYPQVRDVLRLRAQDAGASLVSAGFTRSVAVQRLVEHGVLHPVGPLVRTGARIVVTGDDRSLERYGPAARARIPADAWKGARDALARGPVLVQVPRRGYVPALACSQCRTKSACTMCHGPLGVEDGRSAPVCRWCGHVEHVVTCAECGAHTVRALTIGAGRTAEELGRAFPGVPIRRSGAPEVLATIDDEPALVISTPGAEPVAPQGYAAAILLDAWALLDRPGLDSAERALTCWTTAAALVRPAQEGGVVYLAGVPQHTPFPAVEALVRWAPGWFAERELAERAEVGLPPATRMAAIEGPRRAADAAAVAVEEAARAQGQDVVALGPLPLGRRHVFDRATPAAVQDGAGEPSMRYLVRWNAPDDEAIPHLLRTVRATRSAARESAVTLRADPPLDGLG